MQPTPLSTTGNVSWLARPAILFVEGKHAIVVGICDSNHLLQSRRHRSEVLVGKSNRALQHRHLVDCSVCPFPSSGYRSVEDSFEVDRAGSSVVLVL